MQERRELKAFLAGKIDPLSPHASPYWREELVWHVDRTAKTYRITDTSLVNSRDHYIVERHLPVSVAFAQSCYYIKHSDVLIVNLSDDISIGGSHEMFIARLFNIPVIGIAPRGGKFNKLRFELGGKTYWNWTHPFVSVMCDLVVQDSNELAAALDCFDMIPRRGIQAISSAIHEYQSRASALDVTVDSILSYNGQPDDLRHKLRIYLAGKMGKAAGYTETEWRDHFAALISQKSQFRAINLDFIKPTHDAVNENNGSLIFGRDVHLIRASDAVIVNLSDDISVGGSIEMMLAKLYHRPLIGIARRGGKFVSPNHHVRGNTHDQYVNPFVAATCDWLVHDISELPQAVDGLFNGTVKSSGIIGTAAHWYGKTLMPTDTTARLVLHGG